MGLNLTPLQIIGIILAVNGALTGATAQLTDLFGPLVAKDIVSVASLGSAVLGGIITAMSGASSQVRNVVADPQSQEALIKAVLAMRGVENIAVNKQANATLAAIAIDPTQNKIAPTAAAAQTVEATAKAG